MAVAVASKNSSDGVVAAVCAAGVGGSQ